MQHRQRIVAVFKIRCVLEHGKLRLRQAQPLAGALQRIGIADEEERRRAAAFGPDARRQFEADPGGIAHRNGERLHSIIDA